MNYLTTIITTELPKDTQHGWRYLALGPDDNLYLQIGAPCNICQPDDPYASIIRMDKEGKNMEIYASGVRNSVGFDWHPETKEFWFTDNGRDWLGDNFPPDELNKASQKGLHFGFVVSLVERENYLLLLVSKSSKRAIKLSVSLPAFIRPSITFV